MSSPASPPAYEKIHHPMGTPEKPRSCFQAKKKLWIAAIIALVVVVAIALGVGLGVGLTRGSGSGSGSPDTSDQIPPFTNNTNATTGTYWRPTAGQQWQIVLEYPLNDTSVDVPIYDIDLFDNNATMIQQLHDLDRKVICYFSAGSYEDWRPDADQFSESDYGKKLDGWEGEYWLNTNSTNVRTIMSKRLELAKDKGCDGVDPDNVDAYGNDNGLGLTAYDAVDYLTFLTIEAHGLNMSIGLKNGGNLVNATVAMMQWEVNEQCVQYDECAVFQPYIAAGKPVFHIEYPSAAPSISASVKTSACGDGVGSAGFSTVLKEMSLNDWVEYC